MTPGTFTAQEHRAYCAALNTVLEGQQTIDDLEDDRAQARPIPREESRGERPAAAT